MQDSITDKGCGGDGLVSGDSACVTSSNLQSLSSVNPSSRCSADEWMPVANRKLALVDHINVRSAAVHIQSAKDLLEQELQHALHAVSRIRQKQNSLSPISLLPPEILSRVFMELCAPTGSLDSFWNLDQYQWRGARGILPMVCRIWRSTALNCVGMWTDINFQMDKERVEEFLQRSKNASLCMSPLSELSVWSWEYELISQHMHRVKTFELSDIFHDDLEAFFDLISLCTSDRLVELTLKLDNCETYVLNGHQTHSLRHAPQLHTIRFRGINLPSWDTLPWDRLKFIDLAFLPYDPAASDLALLVASLAIATALEYLHLENITFHPTLTTPHKSNALVARLPQLRSFKFQGAAEDFRQLSGMIHIPSTADLVIFLYPDDRSDAEPSFVSSLLRAHDSRNRQEQYKPIRSMRITTHDPLLSHAKLEVEAWQSCADVEVLDRPSPLLHICLAVKNEDVNAMSAMLLDLCRDVDLSSLQQLHLAICDNKIFFSWDKDTWQTLFSSARAVESVHIYGPYVQQVLEALASPMDIVEHGASEFSQSQPCILFPSLCDLHLYRYAETSNHPETLLNFIKARAQYAPIKAIHISVSNVSSDRQLQSLRDVDGLTLHWDELGDDDGWL